MRDGVASFNFYDSRGDVTTKTNSSGAVTFQTGYEAFGNQTVTSGSTLDRQRASTKEQDPTGLLNEGFRYRDPFTGTFLTRDPLGFKAGLNNYTYVHQNPWTHFDPEGLDTNQPNPPPPPPPKITHPASLQGSTQAPTTQAPPPQPSPATSARGAKQVTDSQIAASNEANAQKYPGMSGFPGPQAYALLTDMGLFANNNQQTLKTTKNVLNAGMMVTAVGMELHAAAATTGLLSAGTTTAETQFTLTQGQNVNRVWDSRWTPASKYSGPFGGSYAPGSALPINAATASTTRGLNIPGVLNNAQKGGVYTVTQPLSATLRTSIGGTEPELLVSPQSRAHLQLNQQSVSTLPPGGNK
jgi:RHS repeat-associated protein